MTRAPDPGWERLPTEAGRSLLAEAASLRAEGMPLERVNRTLRNLHAHEAPLIAAVLTQLTLREEAQTKFGPLSHDMLLTRAGLEQASRQIVADVHATRFINSGVRHVFDLGCGIGAESLAFKRAGLDVTAVDIDPLTAAFAEHNLSLVSGSHRVITGDAVALAHDLIDQTGGVFLDPARRTAGHRNTARLTSPDDYSPSLTFAWEVAHRYPTGIKLGPGFDRALIPPGCEAQWVSVGGDVVEMALWFEPLARAGITRSALVIQGAVSGANRHELRAAEDAPDASVRSIGEFLYEPDGAVIRARLIGLLARELGGGMLDERVAYITSDTAQNTPFAQGFRVIEELPFALKPLSRELRARNIGALEIKKRGVDIDPATLRKKLQLRGTESATLILTRVGEKRRALLTQRL